MDPLGWLLKIARAQYCGVESLDRTSGLLGFSGPHPSPSMPVIQYYRDLV